LLNDIVATCRPDHLLVVDVDQARDSLNRGSGAAELIGVNNLWDIIFSQQPGQEGLRRLGVPMPLEENIEHETVLVHGPPKPVSNAIHTRTHLVEMPPGTPSGFPVAQVFSEEGSELDTPIAESFMTDHHAALVEQFLDVPVTQCEAMIEPDRMLDDGHRETVAVRLGVGHGASAYTNPVKATQP